MLRRAAYALVFAGFAVAGVLVAQQTTGGPAKRSSSDLPQVAHPGAGRNQPAGSVAKFGYLSERGTNRCGLQPEQVATLPQAYRLQGACCSRMDLGAYRHQVQALRRYRGIAEIPKDPYDIPVGLVKRLLGYRSGTRLSSSQRATYDRAMRMSREKGPCCCKCWRWDAFEGLGKHLISRRRWKAPELGRLIDSLNGCGGRLEAGSQASGRLPDARFPGPT